MMGMPRVARRSRVKISPRAGRRAGAASVSASRAPRRQAQPGRPSRAVRPEWSSFVVALPAFLGSRPAPRPPSSSPPGRRSALPEPTPCPARRRPRRRRKPSSLAPRRGQRAGAASARSARRQSAVVVPVAVAGGAEALRARYPLVSALLVELARRPGGARALRRRRAARLCARAPVGLPCGAGRSRATVARKRLA